MIGQEVKLKILKRLIIVHLSQSQVVYFANVFFGPVRDYECACGKYKRIKYKGVICDRCGVEVTVSVFAAIAWDTLNWLVPVSHIWFLKEYA